MNRKMVWLVAPVVLAAFTACATALGLEATTGGFRHVRTYDAQGRIIGFVVTGYTGTSTDIQIPARFRGGDTWGLIGGHPVIGIGVNAFANQRLTSVVIPDSVATIGDGAFFNNRLTSVTIPNSVRRIGDAAFASNELTSVTIPNGVTEIGGAAFMLNRLTSVSIPNSVTAVGDYTFSHNQLTSVTIPGNVTTVGTEAFAYNQLISVTMPSRTPVIRERAFANNQSIVDGGLEVTLSSDAGSVWITGYVGEATDIRIPAQVQGTRVAGIWDDAFAGQQLTSVVIDEGIAVIRYGAFRDNQLVDITIPASVTNIGGNAFEGNQLAAAPLTALQQRQAAQRAAQEQARLAAAAALQAEQGRLAALYQQAGRSFGNLNGTLWSWSWLFGQAAWIDFGNGTATVVGLRGVAGTVSFRVSGTSVIFSEDGEYLYATISGNTLRIVDVDDGGREAVFIRTR